MEDTFYGLLKEGKTDEIMQLLDASESTIRYRDSRGVSLLLLSLYFGNQQLADFILSRQPPQDIHEAAATGDVATLTIFLNEKRFQTDAFSADGFSPLGLASYFRRTEAVRLLLERGAAVNLSSNNSFRVTPLHSAVAANSFDIASLLLKAGADANARQQKGLTPLHSAAHNGNFGICELLLRHGADKTAVSDDGKTALEFAVESNATAIFGLLTLP